MGTSARSAEKRQAARIPVMIQVRYAGNREYRVDYSTNIGTGGLFVNTKKPLPIGGDVELKFLLPGHINPVLVQGCVRWTRDVEQATALRALPGFGVEFVGGDAESSEAIQTFVRRFLPRRRCQTDDGDWAVAPGQWRELEGLYQSDSV